MAVRSLMAVLLAATMFGSPALAQRDENSLGGEPEPRREWVRGDAGHNSPNVDQAGGQQGGWQARDRAPAIETVAPAPPVRALPAPVAESMPQAAEPGWRRERPPVVAQDQRASDGGSRWQGQRDAQGAGAQSPTPAPVAEASRTSDVGVWRRNSSNGWQRREGSPRYEQGGAPVMGSSPQASPQASPQWRDRDRDGVPDRRDWDRNNDGRVDGRWDRNGNGVVDRRYDWNRDGQRDQRGAQGRDWRGDRDYHGRDRSWNDRNWNQRGWDGSGYQNRYGWDRRWRDDRRYDWQRYRYANRHLFRLPRYYAPYGHSYGYQRFGVGIYLEALFYSSRYWISQPHNYRLPEARWPYRWVRYYDDVLLVDTRNGFVIDTIYDFFW